MSALDTQIGGGHYKGMKIQPMEYSMANGLDACQHTAIKYISRFRDKGGIQDLEKAKHCIDMLIEFEQKRLGEETVDAIVKDLAQGSKFGEKLIEACEQVNGQMSREGEIAKDAAEGQHDLDFPSPQSEDPYGPRDAEGWYAWNGDETMRPAGKVQVVIRDPSLSDSKTVRDAEALSWWHGPYATDIVKWRPAQ